MNSFQTILAWLKNLKRRGKTILLFVDQ